MLNLFESETIANLFNLNPEDVEIFQNCVPLFSDFVNYTWPQMQSAPNDWQALTICVEWMFGSGKDAIISFAEKAAETKLKDVGKVLIERTLLNAVENLICGWALATLKVTEFINEDFPFFKDWYTANSSFTQTIGTTYFPSSVPANVTAFGSDGKITISWDNVSNASSYNLYWSNSPGVTKSSNKISGATNPFIHSGLTNGSTYYYAVSAINVMGESDLSLETFSSPQVSGPGTVSLGTTISGMNQNLQIILTNVAWSFDTTVNFQNNSTGQSITMAKSPELSYPKFKKIVLAINSTDVQVIKDFNSLSFSILPPGGTKIELYDSENGVSILATTTPGGFLAGVDLGQTLSGLDQNMQVTLTNVSSNFNTAVKVSDQKTREEIVLSKSAFLSYPYFSRLLLGVSDTAIHSVASFSTLYFTTAPPPGAMIEVRDGSQGTVLTTVVIPGGTKQTVSLGTTVTGLNQNLQILITNVPFDFNTTTTVLDKKTGEEVLLAKCPSLSFPNSSQLTLGTAGMSIRSISDFSSLTFSTPLPSKTQVQVYDSEAGKVMATVNIP
ncbi:MAG: fibronectin type III domain-containing protein [Candidatus Riflebacteria bacterium]|nr:fibronectin type III domain-containing protein [Candidatus Riflebacteria bacterium]